MASAQNGSSATELLKEDCSKAAKENKKVFVMFHASWCGWCHKMDSSMNAADCKQFFDDNFVIRHFVVDESANKKSLETPGAAEFRTQYGGDGQGIPYWLIFDKDGKLLADSKRPDENTGKGVNVGCPANPEEVDYFIEVLKKTTNPGLKLLETIRNRFNKNRI